MFCVQPPDSVQELQSLQLSERSVGQAVAGVAALKKQHDGLIAEEPGRAGLKKEVKLLFVSFCFSCCAKCVAPGCNAEIAAICKCVCAHVMQITVFNSATKLERVHNVQSTKSTGKRSPCLRHREDSDCVSINP